MTTTNTKPGRLALDAMEYLYRRELAIGEVPYSLADLRALVAERDDWKLTADEYGRRLREANRDVDNFGAEADTLRARCERLEAALGRLVGIDWSRGSLAHADALEAARAALAGEGKP